VYVRAGDDFEVSVPRAGFELYGSSYGYNPVSAGGPVSLAEGADEGSILFGETLSKEEVASKQGVFFGEVVTSFRPLLKRYQTALPRVTEGLTSLSMFRNYLLYFHRLPPAYGPNLGSDPVATNVNGYQQFTNSVVLTDKYISEAPSHLMHYLAKGFVGMRGGIRWKIQPEAGVADLGSIAVLRDSETPDFALATSWSSVTGTWGLDPVPKQLTELVNNGELSLWKGSSVVPIKEGAGGIEFELPFYSSWRFIPATCFGVGVNDINCPVASEKFTVRVTQPLTPYNVSVSAYTSAYYAAAEDFTFNFYIGPCTFYTGYTYTISGTV